MSKAEGAELGITISHAGRGMQAQTRVDDVQDLGNVLRFTGGEYPVSGDESRKRFTLWAEFSHRSIWGMKGVRA